MPSRLCLLAACAALVLPAADWPQYAGPDGNFSIPAGPALAADATALKPLWDSEALLDRAFGSTHERVLADGRDVRVHALALGKDLGALKQFAVRLIHGVGVIRLSATNTIVQYHERPAVADRDHAARSRVPVRRPDLAAVTAEFVWVVVVGIEDDIGPVGRRDGGGPPRQQRRHCTDDQSRKEPVPGSLTRGIIPSAPKMRAGSASYRRR
jgi:hypothetical protein